MSTEPSPYREEVVAMIVHELRGPLAAMSNALQLCAAAAEKPEPTAARRLLARQLGKALRLVDDLLDVSRLARLDGIIDGEPIDLAHVVRSEAEDIEPRTLERRQQLSLDLATDSMLVRGDRRRLGQVVANLLDNGSKYSPDGGRIDVHLARELEHVVLTVRDTGVGIRSEELPRLFEPFFRGTAGFTRYQSGLGLGLALVKRLVELHGGTIEARSDGEHRGSEFTVRFPASAP